MQKVSELISRTVDLAILDGTSMRAYVSQPAEAEQPMGLMLFQEAFGVNGWIRKTADRLASLGMIVIAPELYHRTVEDFQADYGDYESTKEHLDALKDEELEQDIRAAYGWLMSEAGVKPSDISSIGFCLGGRVSFLANSILPLKSAACFYGAGICEYPEKIPALYGKMLFVWGGIDRHILPEDRRRTMDALQENGKPFVEALFSEAGHGFFCDERSDFHEASAELVWPLLVQFFHNKNLITEINRQQSS